MEFQYAIQFFLADVAIHLRFSFLLAKTEELIGNGIIALLVVCGPDQFMLQFIRPFLHPFRQQGVGAGDRLVKGLLIDDRGIDHIAEFVPALQQEPDGNGVCFQSGSGGRLNECHPGQIVLIKTADDFRFVLQDDSASAFNQAEKILVFNRRIRKPRYESGFTWKIRAGTPWGQIFLIPFSRNRTLVLAADEETNIV